MRGGGVAVRLAGQRRRGRPKDLFPHPSPRDKLRVLRRLAAEMNALLPQIRARGESIPEQAGEGADRYLGMIESALTDERRP